MVCRYIMFWARYNPVPEATTDLGAKSPLILVTGCITSWSFVGRTMGTRKPFMTMVPEPAAGAVSAGDRPAAVTGNPGARSTNRSPILADANRTARFTRIGFGIRNRIDILKGIL